MENARKNSATREQGNCSRLVRIAGCLLLATGLSLLAGCATAGKAGVAAAGSGIDKSPVILAKLVPARYYRLEVTSESAASLETHAVGTERRSAPLVKRKAPAAAPSSAATVEKSGDAADAAAHPAAQGEKPAETMPANATL